MDRESVGVGDHIQEDFNRGKHPKGELTMGENLPARKDEFLVLMDNPKMRLAIKEVLPKHLTPERIIKMMILSGNKTPGLRECTPASIISCMMACSETGLEPGGVLGECYIIPYGKIATFIIGYRGMIALARRSGQILSIEAHIVYKTDKFLCHFGSESRLEHEPDWETAQRDESIKGAYAVGKIVGGGTQIEVMTKPQIDAIRKRSRASSNGPWVTDYGEMSRKTVVRRLFKYLPVSTSIINEKTGMTVNEAITRDEDFDPMLMPDPAPDALAPGRHPLPKGKPKDAPRPPPEPTPEQVEEAKKALFEERGRAENAIEKALEQGDVLPSPFDEACKAVGIEGDWTKAEDGLVVNLAKYFPLKF
jgi:recombination protein RecT